MGRRSWRLVAPTAAEMRSGERGHACLCPLALALARVFPGLQIQVGRQALSIGGEWTHVPKPISRALLRYDEEGDDAALAGLRLFVSREDRSGEQLPLIARVHQGDQ